MQIYTPWLHYIKFKQTRFFFSIKIAWCWFDCSIIFFIFSIPSVCASHHRNGFLWDAHGWWEVITRGGNRIFTSFVTLKHFIPILKRYLVLITVSHISIVIVLFSHKLRMEMTKSCNLISFNAREPLPVSSEWVGSEFWPYCAGTSVDYDTFVLLYVIVSL